MEKREFQKTNKSSRLKFFYNGTMLTLVGFAMRAAGLFLGAYISSAIGAEGVGLQSLVMTVYSFAVTLATSGVSLSVTRLVAAVIGENRADEGDKILRGAFLYAFLFGAAATAAMFLLGGFIGKSIISDIRTVSALRVLSFSLIPIALSGVISGYFVAVRRVTLNAAVQVIGQALKIAVTVMLLMKFSPMGTEYAIFGLALGVTITEIICFIVSLTEYIFDRRIYRSTGAKGYAMAPVAKMALPLAFSAYVRSFLLSLEHSIIPKRLTGRGNTQEEALSSYGYLHGMALPIILFPMTLLSSFSGLLVPEFAECDGAGNKERMKYIASEALTKTLMYAACTAVFIFTFSEELGYIIYSSYDAGKYIAILAPVIPIMYLDHVTDAMLKGIGEHVFSMWVNIADSLLSVILVWCLIPVLDISGYALCIILMEVFNFTLSFLRLKKRIAFGLPIFSSLVLPLLCAAFASWFALRMFPYNGSITTPYMLILKAVFAACVFALIMMVFSYIKNVKARKRAEKCK